MGAGIQSASERGRKRGRKRGRELLQWVGGGKGARGRIGGEKMMALMIYEMGREIRGVEGGQEKVI